MESNYQYVNVQFQIHVDSYHDPFYMPSNISALIFHIYYLVFFINFLLLGLFYKWIRSSMAFHNVDMVNIIIIVRIHK